MPLPLLLTLLLPLFVTGSVANSVDFAFPAAILPIAPPVLASSAILRLQT
jgi:hypothetical protein